MDFALELAPDLELVPGCTVGRAVLVMVDVDLLTGPDLVGIE